MKFPSAQYSAGKAGSQPLIFRLLDVVNRLDPEALAEVWNQQTVDSMTLEEALIRAGIATERQIAESYSSHYLMPLFDPTSDSVPVDPQIAVHLPSKLCRDHLLAPIFATETLLEIAVFSPDALMLLDEIRLLTGREVRPRFAPLSVIDRLLCVLYDDGNWNNVVTGGTNLTEVDEIDEDQDEDDHDAEEVVHLDQAAPTGRDGRIIRYVNGVFQQALDMGASDIHIEPYEDSCRVRLRVDGALAEISAPPMSMLAAVTSRIKVLSKMDIAEKRMPQDGAIGLRSGDRRIDMRVSTCPTVFGEKVVMRVLDKNAVPHNIANLGLNPRQEKDLLESVQAPHGLMLVTGPTGSGKSTTLYSCLNFLNKPDANICTVEDPVEFKFDGINQIQTQSKVGLTFASALRSFLRQDPDVIMVGEVRDGETAEICMRAALTGHFVLSTLHTNDALAAITRLSEMGTEPFLLANTLRLVIAQRLVRRLCNDCKQPFVLDDATAERYKIEPGTEIFRSVGCSNCRQSGYKGRVAVFEIIRINSKLADLIQSGASHGQLVRAACDSGMQLLRHSVIEKVVAGLTSLEEAISLTVAEE